MKNVSILIMLLNFILFTGCVSTTNLGTAGADRKQLLIIPQKSWTANAEKSYKRFINQAKHKQVLVIDRKLDHVLDNLKIETEVYRNGASHWDWEVNGNLNGSLDARGFPGGKIIVNTGLYWGLKLTEDELAFVIAHEMAHALRDHQREKMSTMLVSQVAVMSTTAGLGALASVASSVASQASFTPQMWNLESEADVLALDIMVRAGYNPESAIHFWNKFQQESLRREKFGVKPMMSHEIYLKRIHHLQSYLPALHKTYESAQVLKSVDASFVTQNLRYDSSF